MTYQSLEGASRICLIYQVFPYHKDEYAVEYTQTYYEALNQTLLTQKYRESSPNAFYVLEAYVTQYEAAYLKISILKNFH